MGLDGVELVMATEDEFGVQISDQQAAEMRTVGNMVDWVEQALRGKEARMIGISTVALDEECQRLFGMNYKSVPMDQPIREIITTRAMSDASIPWHAIGIPEPRRPSWMIWTITGLAVAAFFIPLILSGGSEAGLGTGIFSGFVLYGFLLVKTGNYRRVRSGKTTFADVLEKRARLHRKALQSYPSRSEVFEKVRDIIVRELKVTPEQVKEEVRFIEDLDVD